MKWETRGADMDICGKCGVVMTPKERKTKRGTYVYSECPKCGDKTKSFNKDKLLRAG